MIELNGVGVRYGAKEVIHDVSFVVNKGDVVSLIGLNGAGKTTLLKVIIGIVKPNTGSVKVGTKKVAYVPQKLLFDRTIPITVSEFLKLYSSSSDSEIVDKLSEVGSEDLFALQMGALSGGQLQRVLIANALLMEPELLLLDEATAGVDVQGEKQFYELISKIHKQYGMTIILVSHDIHTVFANSDWVLCLNGCICCHGKPDQVVNNEAFKQLYGDYIKPYKHKHNQHDHATDCC